MIRFFLVIIMFPVSYYGQDRDFFKDSTLKYFKEGNTKKALKLSRSFFSKYPKDTLSMIYYADALQEIDDFGNKRKIVKLYDKLIKLDSTNFNFYNLKGYFLLRVEDFYNAMLNANKSLKYSENIDSHIIIGLSSEGLLDTLSSNENFSIAFRIDSSNSYLNYKYAYTMYYRKNYVFASKYFIKFLSLINKRPELSSFAFIPDLIISLWNINDKEKAFYYWEIYSKNNEAHYNFRFNSNALTKEIKKYCEDRLNK